MAAQDEFVMLSIFLASLCLIPSGGLASDIAPCQSICSSTYQGSDEERICERGCRLMTIVNFFNEDMSLDQTRTACLQACSEAYGTVNGSACAFGCQSQLPSIEDSRKQLAKEAEESENMVSMSASFNGYYGRMMNCMMQHVQHQMTIGWMVVSSSASTADGGRVVVIRGTPVLVFRQPPENALEYKTSNYLETNLQADDGGATPDVKRSQMMPMMDLGDTVAADVKDDRTGFDYRFSDWLSCLSNKTGLSKLSIIIIIFGTLVVLMWFIVGLLFPASHAAKEGLNQKLSIYGDHDYLMTIDEKKYLPGYVGISKFNGYAPAPPLPLKMQEI